MANKIRLRTETKRAATWSSAPRDCIVYCQDGPVPASSLLLACLSPSLRGLLGARGEQEEPAHLSCPDLEAAHLSAFLGGLYAGGKDVSYTSGVNGFLFPADNSCHKVEPVSPSQAKNVRDGSDEENENVKEEIDDSTYDFKEHDSKFDSASVEPTQRENSSESESDDSPHEEIRKFRCNECPDVFKDIKKFRAHMREHRYGTQAYNCTKCEVVSQDFDSHQKHKQKHRVRRDRTKEKKYVKKVLPRARWFACKHCEYKAPKVPDLNRHMIMVHEETINSFKVFYCDQCPRKCDSKKRLEDHKLLHAPPTLLCQESQDCRKMFHEERGLKKHIQICHTPDQEKPFQCDQCGKGFLRNETLQEHINVHLGVKPHTCAHCGRSFSNISNLQSHTKKLHPEHFVAGTRKSIRVK